MTHFLEPTNNRAGPITLIVGIIGLVIGIIGYFTTTTELFHAYLFAFVFWISISLGSLAILMVGHISGGRWTVPMTPLLSASIRTLPLMLLLFLPLLLGIHDLYEWSHAGFGADNPALQIKSAYLNQSFFLVRNGIYFVIWLALLLGLVRGRGETVRRISAFGLILYGLTVTFASVDWIMSLEATWFSSIYGLLLVSTQAVLALSLLIALSIKSEMGLSVIQDLGNILLAALMTWAYLNVIQLIVIWSGNLPEEIIWYVRRLEGGWEWFTIITVFASFVIPFSLLLSSPIKRRVVWLRRVAWLVVTGQVLYMFWLIKPAFYPNTMQFHLLDFVLFAGIGGLWMAIFRWQYLRLKPETQEGAQHVE